MLLNLSLMSLLKIGAFFQRLKHTWQCRHTAQSVCLLADPYYFCFLWYIHIYHRNTRTSFFLHFLQYFTRHYKRHLRLCRRFLLPRRVFLAPPLRASLPRAAGVFFRIMAFTAALAARSRASAFVSSRPSTRFRAA